MKMSLPTVNAFADTARASCSAAGPVWTRASDRSPCEGRGRHVGVHGPVGQQALAVGHAGDDLVHAVVADRRSEALSRRLGAGGMLRGRAEDGRRRAVCPLELLGLPDLGLVHVAILRTAPRPLQGFG
jgi:hypothetical protein